MENSNHKKCKYCGRLIGKRQVIHNNYCSEICYEWATNKCFMCGKDLNGNICKDCSLELFKVKSH